MKLKVTHEELQVVIQLLNQVVKDFESREDLHRQYNWCERLLTTVLKDVLITAFLKRLINQKEKYTFTLKPFESEAMMVGIMRSESWCNDPYALALIQKIKTS